MTKRGKKKMVGSEREALTTFNRKIAGLKRAKRFVEWNKINEFANDLYFMLEDLKVSVKDPLVGMACVAAFYETDCSVFERSNDRTGTLVSLYMHYAQELFAEYASRCEDKEKVGEILLEILSKDKHGVRGWLIDSAGDYLPEPVVRSMIAVLKERAENPVEEEETEEVEDDDYDEGDEEDEEKGWYERSQNLSLIKSLAKQIKDAKLFEETCRASYDGELTSVAYVDVAQVYLDCGDVEMAQAWLEKIPEDGRSRMDEREQILLGIYRLKGDSEQEIALLRQRFCANYSVEKLQALLDVIGEDQRDDVIAEAVAAILASTGWEYSDADFLIALGRLDDAEAYLLGRAELLNGRHYTNLLAYVKVMEAAGKRLVTSLLYRSLLVDILERKYTKAYPHGIRYLKKLDALSEVITDWKRFENHEIFKARMMEEHGKKWSFWEMYGIPRGSAKLGVRG